MAGRNYFLADVDRCYFFADINQIFFDHIYLDYFFVDVDKEYFFGRDWLGFFGQCQSMRFLWLALASDFFDLHQLGPFFAWCRQGFLAHVGQVFLGNISHDFFVVDVG